MRGDLGALVGADALAPLGDELVHELPHARADDQRETDEHDRGADHAAAQRAPRVDAHEERAEPGGDARDPGDDARERAAPRPEQHRDRVGRVGRQPVEERPVGRLGRVVARTRARATPSPTSAAPSGHTITSPGHSPTARTSSSTPSTTARERDRRDRVGRGAPARASRSGRRHQQPARAVEQHAEPARERQHEEAAAHDVRVDADRVAEPGGDARDDATVVAADEAVPFEAHPAMIAPPARPRGSGRNPHAGAALRVGLRDLPDGARRPAGARSTP